MRHQKCSSCAAHVQDYFPQDASTQEIADRVTDGTVITLQQFSKKGNLWHACGCYNEEFDFTMDDAQQFRSMSDRYVASGRYPNRFGWSNLLWSWGQFIDHDVVRPLCAGPLWHFSWPCLLSAAVCSVDVIVCIAVACPGSVVLDLGTRAPPATHTLYATRTARMQAMLLHCVRAS